MYIEFTLVELENCEMYKEAPSIDIDKDRRSPFQFSRRTQKIQLLKSLRFISSQCEGQFAPSSRGTSLSCTSRTKECDKLLGETLDP